MLSNYDEFAGVYNRHWGGDSLNWFRKVDRLVLDHLHPHSNVLDVCCGTGQVAEKLTRQGFKTVGVDASLGMLRHAAVNAPRGRFVCADVRRFGLTRKFDAAISLFDSLNHLLTLEDFESALQNVSTCLASVGVFAFDLNTEIKYRTSWSGTWTVDDPGTTTEVITTYREDTRLAEFHATISSRDRDRPAVVRLFQTWYSVSTVVQALERSGFTDVSCISLNRDRGIEETGRVLFVARK